MIDRSDRIICAAAMAASLLAAGSLIVPVPGALRAVAVLVFCCWSPGVTLFAMFRAWNLVRSLALTVTVSLSLVVLLSQLALVVRLWSPGLATGAIASVCAVLLVPAVFVPRWTGLPE